MLVKLADMVRACQFCRRRKIKCDTTKPTCTTCRSTNRSCIYDCGPPKQRPSAALINNLRDEKTALAEILGRLKDGDELQRHALLDSLTVQDGRVLLPNSPAASTTPSSQGRQPPKEQPSLVGDEPSDFQARCSDTGGDPVHVDGRDGRHAPDGPDGDGAFSDEGEEGTYVMSEHEAARQDNPAGETIFSSTAIHGANPAPPRDTRGFGHPLARTDNSQALRHQLVANAATERQREHRLRHLATIRDVPAPLVMHLLDLHWSRQHHTFLLTYRPTFMRELVDGGPYCSDLLLYAVLACSAKFSERVDVRSDPTDPETAGRQFFTRCDDLLMREGLLSQSRIPTIIALLMLGSTFIGRGLTSKGWLYTGYALRMVYDLGLHIDVQEVHSANAEETEIRRRVFWGAFICEKLQSLYLARPPTIGLRDARVSRDFMDTFEELEPWEPYQDPQALVADAEVARSPIGPACTYSVSVFQQLCLLSRIMTRIMNKIYFVGATAGQTLNEVVPLDDSLTSWYRDLPEHLAFEPWTKSPTDPPVVVAPNRIILLTTYHSLIVLLHRPFISSGNSNNPNGFNHISSVSPFSWKKCTTAARNITSLALSYRSIYPLRRSNYLLSYAVYVACTIHVLNAASLSASGENNGYAELSLLLGASLRCLDELAVPNSGLADTARIIRKLMLAKGVAESPSKFLAAMAEPTLYLLPRHFAALMLLATQNFRLTMPSTL